MKVLIRSIFIWALLINLVASGSQAMARSLAYVGGDDGRFYVIDQEKKEAFSAISFQGVTFTGSVFALTPDGTKLYLPDDTNHLRVVNTNTHQTTQALTLAGKPLGFAMNHSGTRLYISDASGVVIVNPKTDTISSSIALVNAARMAVSSDDKKLYVIRQGSSAVAVVDAVKNQLITTISLGMGNCNNPNLYKCQIAVSPDGLRAYITVDQFSDGAPDNVLVVDLEKNQLLTPIVTGDGNKNLVISQDGSKIYVSNFADNTVSVIDVATHQVTTSSSFGDGLQGLDLSSSGAELWVASRKDHTVYILDSNTLAVTRKVESVGLPTALGHFMGPDLCGNGVLEDKNGKEECDDGNANSGDGCSSQCITESCGDGVLNNNPDPQAPTEQCDKADLGGKGCAEVVPNTAGTLVCKNDCQFDSSQCLPVTTNPGENTGENTEGNPSGGETPGGDSGASAGGGCGIASVTSVFELGWFSWMVSFSALIWFRKKQ